MLRYGFLTARGNAGGRAGVNVEPDSAAAVKKRPLSAPRMESCMVRDTRILRADGYKTVVSSIIG